MNSRRIQIFFFTVLIKASLFAQTSVGVEGGLSYNTYHTNIANRSSTELTGLSGFNLDLPFRYKVYPWLYITTAPGIVQKGYSMDRTDSLYGEYDRHINTFLQLPVGVSLQYEWRRLRGTLDPGFYAGYWLSGRVKGAIADIFGVSENTNSAGQTTQQFRLRPYDDPYSFLSQRDNRWQFGWVPGLGLQYHLTGRYWLTASSRYHQSITSQEKASVSPIPAYNHTWTFSIGGLFSLDKK